MVRELRKGLGLTQQALAVQMGKAVVTVARWETSRPPGVLALLELAGVAEENRLYDIAYRLTELAFPLPLPSTESLRTLKVGEDLQGALTLILRNQHIVEARKAWNTVRAATLRALATLVAKGEAGENIHGDPAAIKDFHERIVEIPKPARHVARPKMPHPK